MGDTYLIEGFERYERAYSVHILKEEKRGEGEGAPLKVMIAAAIANIPSFPTLNNFASKIESMTNVIYYYFSHYHYFSHFESKGASPLPHAGGINTEAIQKFSMRRG